MNNKWFQVLEENYQNIGKIVILYTTQFALFEEAYKNKDRNLLETIMDDAWFSAPEAYETRLIPSFMIMCELLDGTYDVFKS